MEDIGSVLSLNAPHEKRSGVDLAQLVQPKAKVVIVACVTSFP